MRPAEVPSFVGVDLLVNLLGYWPTLHDADVLHFRLDRRAYGDNCYGPTIDVLVNVFDFDKVSQLGSDGRHTIRHSVSVHMRFRDVVELHLEGFNAQNKLHGLTIIDIHAWQLERISWTVRFDSTLGLNASFKCCTVEVIHAEPCDMHGEALPV